MQTLPDSHITSLQAGSTQYPAALQTRFEGQANSPVVQAFTHAPLSQTKSVGQIGPSSVVPSQLSSRPLQVSAPAAPRPLHVVPLALHWVTPGPQAPGRPVSQGCPPPEQVSPVSR